MSYLFQVFELFSQYVSFTATTQMYNKREEAPFPDVSICNLEPKLDDVIAVKDYLAKLDDVITENHENIDVVNQVRGLRNKFAMFQNLDNAPLEEIDRYFVAECFWITNKRQYKNCSEYVSRLIYTGTFGQCYTFSTLLWRNTWRSARNLQHEAIVVSQPVSVWEFTLGQEEVSSS